MNRKILLLQLDGSIPSHALMRLAYEHRALGDEVRFRRMTYAPAEGSLYASTGENFFAGEDRVYASAIFERTRPVAERLLRLRPDAIVGGSGWPEIQDVKLEDVGFSTGGPLDYSIYPQFADSLAFTSRGCRLACSFCLVHKMEGWVREATPIEQVWRGEPYPKHLLLLDNDFFGSKLWEHKINFIRANDFKVCITQGINVRLGTRLNLLTDEAAAAIASVRYYDNKFKRRRLYTAWDNRKDEDVLFRGLEALAKYGVKPDHVMVYMLVAFWPGETDDDWEYRRLRLREWGARPYPMPYVRTREALGFQRFVVGAYDKRFTWAQWKAAGYRPEKLGMEETAQMALVS